MADTQSDIALVLEAYAAFARGDIDTAVASMHPEVEWIEPDEFLDGGRRVGPAAVAEYLQASYDSWDQLTSTYTATRQGPDIVVLHHVCGTLKAGVAHEATVADVFTVQDSQIVRMRAYADLAQVPGQNE